MKHVIVLITALLLGAPTAALAEGGGANAASSAAPRLAADDTKSTPPLPATLSARRTALLPTVRAATPSGLPLALVDAVIIHESGYRATVRGSRGEVGLMQILPATARGIARTAGLGGVADLSNAQLVQYLSEPSNNLRVGLAYLSWCHARAKGNLGATIGCYNAGPGNMWRWEKIAITRNYVRKVENHMANAGS
jgi:soluble lytic murein transglycosylase-like protein